MSNEPIEYPGEKKTWEGFELHTFELADRECRVVVPKRELPGRPWIWRARFFGTAPGVDIALLNKGFHVAYIDVVGLFGAPEAVVYWNCFYQYLTRTLHFNKRMILEGMSRGGLILYNWAKRNPEKVICVYADAPVCDIKSWPGIDREGYSELRDQLMKIYGFNMIEEMVEFNDNPIDNLEPLVRCDVPILHVCGDQDTSVPIEENTYILKRRYEELGGKFELIIKKGAEHHPHGLEEPSPIINFIFKHYGAEK